MDISGSMNATDVAPTRLAAAKESARAFVDQLPAGIRVGLVAFSTEPRTVVEPTDDRAFFLQALDRLIARGGTAMGDAIDSALDIAEEVRAGGSVPDGSVPDGVQPSPAPSTAPDGTAEGNGDGRSSGPSLVAAVLLSDGFNSVGDTEPLDAADRAAALGVPIYTIALGTPTGTVVVPDQFGRPTTVEVPPDTVTLARIAEITGATAFDAPTAEDLRTVYETLESRIGFEDVTQEVTVWFVAGALLFVVVGAGAAGLWFGRFP
jgi:Ca-activated chloride channel family protein